MRIVLYTEELVESITLQGIPPRDANKLRSLLVLMVHELRLSSSLMEIDPLQRNSINQHLILM